MTRSRGVGAYRDLMSLLGWARRYGDLLWALSLAALVAVELATWRTQVPLRGYLYGLLLTLPLAWRRTQPLVAFVLVMVGIQLLGELLPRFDNDSMAFVLAFLHALYSVGRNARGQQRWIAAALLPVVGALFMQDEGGIQHADLGDLAFLVGFIGAPWAAGLTLALRRERETVLRAENERLQAEQAELARRAVAEERARIARELHDVVSHAISVTVLQSRGARATLGRDEEQVRRSLDAIEQTNTAALGDMRRLLAVLRDADTEVDGDRAGTDLAPQPSLDHLDALLQHVRGSGVPVELEVTGTRGPVPPGVDLSAYRIVQEALTNVLKHAGSARARVRLDYLADALHIRVSDDGTSTMSNGATTDGGAGHGLIGIRERVAVVGGSVAAGPQPEGGYAVDVRLPFSVEFS